MSDILEVLAQISLPVAGFAGVAGAFRSTGQPRNPWDLVNIRMVLVLSFAACGLSLVPLLSHWGWVVYGWIFIVSWIGILVFWWLSGRGIKDPKRGPWWLGVIAYIGSGVLAGISICKGSLGEGSTTTAEEFYSGAVALLIALAASFFIAFVSFFRPTDENAGSK